MTPTQIRIAVAGGLALLAWLLTPKAVGRRTTEIEIDADVYSPTFGEPIAKDDPAAWNPELRRPVDESARRIREHDAASVQNLDD